MTSPVITVFIPTYDNRIQLFHAVSTMWRYVSPMYRVHIGNNNSGEEWVGFINEMVTDFGNRGMPIEVTHYARNFGDGATTNLAASTACTEFFSELNDDVMFVPGQEDFWSNLIEHCRDESVGGSGPSTTLATGSVQSIKRVDLPIIHDVNFLHGFCMAFRTERFLSMGGFDDKLPGGYDVDLSIRLADAGYRLVIDRRSFLVHLGGSTIGKSSNESKWISSMLEGLLRKHGKRRMCEMDVSSRQFYSSPCHPEEAYKLMEHLV